jgi:hypothetical protein
VSILLSDQSRLLALIIGCAVLWSIESLLPLYKYETNRLRRALPKHCLNRAPGPDEPRVVVRHGRNFESGHKPKVWPFVFVHYTVLDYRGDSE